MAQYYIHPNGSDSNPGTLNQPWKTVAKANNTLRAGDTVYLRNGEYQDLISPVNNGSLGNPITYTRYQEEIPLVVGSGPDKPGVVCLGWVPVITGTGKDRELGYATFGTGKNYITVDGLHISYKWSQDPTFQFTAGEARFAHIRIDAYESTGNIIRNCKIYQATDGLDNYMNNYQQAGILFCGNTCTLENNDISGFWLGIWLAGRAPRNCIVRNNYIHDIGSSPIDCGSPESTLIQSTLIEDNILGPSWNEDGIQFEPDYGHIGEVRNMGVVIRRNKFVGCAENSIDLKGAGQILIEDNVAYSSPGQDNGGIEWDYALNKTVRDTTGTKYYTASDGSKRLLNNRGGGAGFITLGSGENTKNIIVRNNITYDNKNQIGPILSTYKKMKIYNNTFVNGNRDFTGPNSVYGGGQSRDGFQSFVCYGAGSTPDLSYGFVFKNNIAASHNDGEISLNLYGFDRAPSKQLDLDYNLYSNPNGVRLVDPAGGQANFYSFPAWKAYAGGRGYELHSKEAPTPGFVNVPSYPVGAYSQFDFNLTPTSLAKGAGAPMTHTIGANSGTTVRMFDAEMFCDGYGVVPGDSILVGLNAPVRVLSIVDGEHLVVDRSISWNDNDGVSLERLGMKPDIGASLQAAPPLGPPIIVTQPITQSVEVGQMPTFLVFATGEFPLAYQWKKNGVDISGANSASYSLTPTLADNGDAFTCYVSNSQGWNLSNVAMLWVTEPSPTGNLIQNPSFDGESPWFFYANSPNSSFAANGVGIVTLGGTGSNIQLSQPGLPIEAGKVYRLAFEAKSEPAQGLGISVLKNTTPYTNLGLKENFNLTPNWETFSTSFTATESSIEGRLMFWIAPWGSAGDIFSFDNVILEEVTTPVIIPPSIVVQPQSLSVTEGSSASFSIEAAGTEPLTYQWLLNGQIVYGETLPSWTIESTDLDMNGDWIACEVTNSAGVATSASAILTVVASHDYARGYADGYAAAKAEDDIKWKDAEVTVNTALDTLTVQAGVQFSIIKQTMAQGL